jgi:hypothetical protein
MQTLLTENDNRSLLSRGLEMATQNIRYVVWFYGLSLLLAWFGSAAFRTQADSILGRSLYSDRLVHGFDLTVLIEMVARPEFGSPRTPMMPATDFAFVFFLFTALLLPGVFQGYASTYRLPRDQFFRACGRNLWRFVRLLLIGGLIIGVLTGVLFAMQGALAKKAGDSTNEMLPFYVSVTCIAVIFLVMTVVRIWFDLAEVDVVLSDQNAVRKSIGAAFGHTFRSLGRLLASYILITVTAALVLIVGLWVWMKFVPADNVFRAFFIAQLTLFFLLIPRFWQRGVAVAYYQQKMVVPVYVPEPVAPDPMPAPVLIEPEVSPLIPNLPPAPQEG